jgi:uncharacterized protein
VNICLAYKRRFWLIVLPVFIFAMALFFWLNLVVFPMAPNKVVITSGPKDGMYIIYAQKYAEILRKYGLEVEVLESPGSVQNIERMRSIPQTAQVGIIEGGTNQILPETASDHASEHAGIQTIANIDLEPVWIFSRKGEANTLLNFSGKRLSAAEAGSGSRLIVLELMRQLGHERKDFALISAIGSQTIQDLIQNKTDIGIYVAPLRAPYIQKMLAEPKLQLVLLERNAAIVEHMPYLELRPVYKGSINTALNQPSQDSIMLTTVANLVVSDNLHPAVKRLVAQAAREFTNEYNVFYKPGEFPNLSRPDFATALQAREILRFGLGGFEKYLSLRSAQWMWRLLWASPIFLFLYWLTMVSIPKMMRAYIVTCINRWYGELSFIDNDMRQQSASGLDVQKQHTQLRRIEDALSRFDVPKELMQRAYMLKHHIDTVRNHLFMHRGR